MFLLKLCFTLFNLVKASKYAYYQTLHSQQVLQKTPHHKAPPPLLPAPYKNPGKFLGVKLMILRYNGDKYLNNHYLFYSQ